MEILCFDAEFTENEELLELSVYNLEGKEVYHSYYRPERIKTWRTDIHHITPAMVAGEATFGERRGEVEQLLKGAFALSGFSVGNDIRVLSRSGVEGLEDMRVLDVKDMYWYVRGRAQGMNPFAVPSLLVCANSLGLDFGEEEAHSASADTEATVRSFNALMEEYMSGEGSGLGGEEAVERFIGCIEEARAEFVEETAKGYVKLLKAGPYHKLKFGREPEQNRDSLALEIEVADRYKAEYDLRKKLKKKEVPGKINLYKLSARLIEEIGGYRNAYDAEESTWCKKVVRNLGRLSL